MFEVLEKAGETTEGNYVIYSYQNRTFRLDKEKARARLAGKRVINGVRSAELNVLPLKYHEAYRIYRQNARRASFMYREAWEHGLKTTYYLRTLNKSGIDSSHRERKSAELTPFPAEPACSGEAACNGTICEMCQ